MVDITVQAYAKAGAHRIKVEKGGVFIYAVRHLRSIFIRTFINRKRNCKIRRRIFKNRRKN